MTRQWQDELEVEFGLASTIVDRDYLASLRRERAYGTSPWASGTRFSISDSLLADGTCVGGLRDRLGELPGCHGNLTGKVGLSRKKSYRRRRRSAG